MGLELVLGLGLATRQESTHRVESPQQKEQRVREWGVDVLQRAAACVVGRVGRPQVEPG